jgi:single-stranded-DNA-specific exonuclease
MKKKLLIHPPPDAKKIQELRQTIPINDVLLSILINRGYDTFEKVKDFFRPELKQLHDPFLMTGMAAAVDRIMIAMAMKQKILIYGDYDVDGTTAVSLMYLFFDEVLNYKNTGFYIPDRYSEGYGISFKGIDYASDNDFSLIIALDCGVKAIDKVEYARSLNIDFIICDHHLPGDELPKAIAMLNPKQLNCSYPFKELSGCGIGFKLSQALCMVQGIPMERAYNYLDLVTVSTCSDIVPIVGENRILVFYGLKKINECPGVGLAHLLKNAGVKRKNLTVEDVVFIVGPRINAAGRLKHGSMAVELLTGRIDEEMIEQSLALNKNNEDRKEIDKKITLEALEIIRNDEKYHEKKTTVVYNENWHKGVVGIVASRLIEHHYRPTIVLTQSEGKITGSARSVKDFDVYESIEKCSEFLENFGGHMYAAGLTMKQEHLQSFIQKFDETVRGRITEELLVPKIEADAEIPLNLVNFKFYNVLKQFAPFGPGNMNPVFYTSSLELYHNDIRIVKGNHLQFKIHDPESGIGPIQCIAFKKSDLYDQLLNAEKFSICYHINENVWNENITLQLDVKEIFF